MKRAVLIAIVAVALASPRPAQACRCDEDGFVLPVGAEDVPVNTKIFAKGSCTDPVLLDASETPVPLEVEPELHGMIVRRPAVPLALGGTYTIECGVDVGSFTVTAPADEAPPPPPQVTHGAFVSENQGSCGSVDYRSIAVAADDAEILLLDLEQRGSDTPARRRTAERIEGVPIRTLVGRGACRGNWSFDELGQPHARWGTLDLAGNQSDWTAWDVVVDGGCAMAPPTAGRPWPVWFTFAVVALRRARRGRARPAPRRRARSC